ncbi:MAG TPA: hypothetical protein DCS43_10850, partial [Verrucomicrobia bacterium]|nr:hypothetical protein [Verrucomicrobiota bacterium]
MSNGVKNTLSGIGRGAIALLALAVVLGAANVIIRTLRLRVDLTEAKLYTLSEGSRNLLGKLDQPVTLKLFFNSSNARVPSSLRTYAKQVEDLLTEYRIAGNGNIIIEKVDPKPDSDEEEWARKYGIAGAAVEVLGQPLYFGLVAVAGSTEAVMPALDPRLQQMLEFNISRMINQVTNPKKTVIGVISSLPVLGGGGSQMMPGMPMMQPPTPAWIAFQEIRKDADVRQLDNPEAGIDEDIDVLVVVHPKALSPLAQFAIDQHILRGGRALIFVDPISVADQEGGNASPYGMPSIDSDLSTLFKAWGIGYSPAQVLADYSAATPMQTPEGGIENNPVVVTYGQANLGKDNIMTAGLQTLRGAFAGVLQDKTSGKLKVTPLITASAQSGSVGAMVVRGGGRAVRESFAAVPEPQHLAIQVAGKFQTAFPEGRPAAAEGEEAPATNAAPLTAGESTVVIVSDVDILFDPICVESMRTIFGAVNRPLNDNLSFFANVIDTLSGGSDLISIRSRSGDNRPFTRVDKIEAKAINRWREEEAKLEASLREARQQLEQ